MAREQGHYWVCWTDRADKEVSERRPGPLMGLWDGKVWWFHQVDRYYFDCELRTLSQRLAPPLPILKIA